MVLIDKNVVRAKMLELASRLPKAAEACRMAETSEVPGELTTALTNLSQLKSDIASLALVLGMCSKPVEQEECLPG